MLFGTSKKRDDKHLNVSYRDKPINETTYYKYLGILLDQSLLLTGNFAEVYKKASSQLRLLHKLRNHVDQDVAKKIYQTMTIPILTFSSTASHWSMQPSVSNLRVLKQEFLISSKTNHYLRSSTWLKN